MSDSQKSIMGFLFAHRWGLAPHGTQGITWLELLVLFFLHGGNHQLAGLPATDDTEPVSSLRVLLAAFKRNVRKVVDSYIAVDSAHFFRPSKAGHLRLKSIGFANHAAAIVGNISHISSVQAAEVVRILVGLRHKFTRNSTKLWNEGNLKLQAIRISYRIAPPLCHNSKLFPQLDIHTIAGWAASLAEEPVARPNSFFLFCPNCVHHKEVSNIVLLRDGLWKALKCTNCNGHKSTRQWHCQCRIQWHSCLLHAGLGHACRPIIRQLQRGENANNALTLQQPIADAGSISSRACILANSVESRGVKRRLGDLTPKTGLKRSVSGFTGCSDTPKRVCYSPSTGIPSTFLPQSLAKRFKSSVAEPGALIQLTR